MKRIQAIIASVIITGLVISGMLAIGVDAMRTANKAVATASTASLALNSTSSAQIYVP